VKPADIHRQICEVYGENAMSDGMGRKLVRKFNEGRDNVRDEPRSGRPSVVTGGHVLRGEDTETGAINALIMVKSM
jgi:transposase